MLLAAACAVPEPEPVDDFRIDDPVDVFRLTELREVNGDHAATSEICYWCHANTTTSNALRDQAGRPVSPWDLWRGSMMANSARDPLFRATVAAEQASLPPGAEDISGDCMTCHAPAAFAEATLRGDPAPTIDILPYDDDLSLLARDGANCVGCHLLDPSRVGGEETWSGHHPYNADRLLYGPHQEPALGPMERFADFTPAHHDNALDGAMCASCHMLQTEARDADGRKTGHVLTEQAPFVEWRSSAFDPAKGQPEAQTCQNCHLPTVDEDGELIRTQLARGFNVGNVPAREPFGRHQLVGGNTFGLQLLYDYRWDLGIGGPGPSLEASIAATRANLATSARIETGTASLGDGRLTLPVTVYNEVGHKLPTGYPSRRAWLEVRVTDSTGATVVHVGATNDEGRLLDGKGHPLGSEFSTGPLPPHRTTVRRPEHVLVWQSWMQTSEGEPTTRLLRGATYAKDNRLLPRGWNPTPSDAPLVAPVGTEDDPDFIAGSDTVLLDLAVAGQGPYTVDLTVRYQAFSPRFLDELFAVRTIETASLQQMLSDRGVPAEVMATAVVTVE